MQSSYQLSEKDLLEAQTSHAGRLFRISQIFGAFLIAAGLGGVVFGQGQYAPVPIVIGLFLLFRLRLSAKLAFRRDVAAQGKVEVTASQAGIQFLSARGTADLKWDAFLRYTETKNLFMLYPQSRLFNIIPKRAFTPQDLQEFRQALQQNLAAKSASHNKKVSPQVIVLLAVVLVVAILLGIVLARSNG